MSKNFIYNKKLIDELKRAIKNNSVNQNLFEQVLKTNDPTLLKGKHYDWFMFPWYAAESKAFKRPSLQERYAAESKAFNSSSISKQYSIGWNEIYCLLDDVKFMDEYYERLLVINNYPELAYESAEAGRITKILGSVRMFLIIAVYKYTVENKNINNNLQKLKKLYRVLLKKFGSSKYYKKNILPKTDNEELNKIISLFA